MLSHADLLTFRHTPDPECDETTDDPYQAVVYLRSPHPQGGTEVAKTFCSVEHPDASVDALLGWVRDVAWTKVEEHGWDLEVHLAHDTAKPGWTEHMPNPCRAADRVVAKEFGSGEWEEAEACIRHVWFLAQAARRYADEQAKVQAVVNAVDALPEHP